MKTKKCSVCNNIKSTNEFYKSKNYFKSRCKKCCKVDSKEYFSKNKTEHQQRCKEWQMLNKDKQSILSKKSYNNTKQDKEKIKNKYDYNKKYHLTKYKDNIEFKIKRLLRNRLIHALNKNIKTQSAIKLIGCDINKLKQYLETQFKPEMNWDNHGVIWEVDHIKPCASFDLTDIEQQKQCFHYTNLQPLFKTSELAESLGYINEIGNRDKKDKIYVL